MARIQKLTSKVPVITAMVAIVALIVYVNPSLIDHTLYDRPAVQQGQLWRILTAPLTHFSTSHLAWNLILFLPFGAMLETFRRRSLLLVIGLTALATGVIYVIFVPNLLYYGGLSGVLTGIVAYLGLVKINRQGNSKFLWAVVLLLLMTKILIENLMNKPIFVATEGENFHVLPSSHMIGFSVAAFLCYLDKITFLLKSSIGRNFRGTLQSKKRPAN